MIESGIDSVIADAVLGVHIVAGLAALGAGLGAIVTRKGGKRHNTAGKLYVWAMAVVVVTAVPLAAGTANWFLLAIAVFSGYLVFGGYRAVSRRRAGLTAPTTADYVGHGTMSAVGGAMIAVGGWGTITGSPGLAPALAVFGGISAGLAVSTLLQFRQSPADRPPWIRSHIAFLGGAYIATVTATITVNLTMVPPLARWLGPTILGVPLIGYALHVYAPRFAPSG